MSFSIAWPNTMADGRSEGFSDKFSTLRVELRASEYAISVQEELVQDFWAQSLAVMRSDEKGGREKNRKHWISITVTTQY